MKKGNQTWLKLFNVHTHEWEIVKKLFWLQFFQGAGISFFFTSEFTRFIIKYPVQQLPWVMILSAVLLWAAGFLYTKFEHSTPFKRFNLSILAIMAGSMLLIRIGSHYFQADWFFYLSLAWFYVLYLLDSLVFWGIAAQLFDIRQSKRLFGVISAGDIPAKFIGYTLAGVVVTFTGINNLLLIGLGCILCSFPIFLSIARSEEKTLNHHAHGGHHTQHNGHHPAKNIHHSGRHTVGNLVQNFLNTSIILKIAVVSLLASACMVLVNYGFYAKVKEAYHDDLQLATFIAMFKAGLSIAALVTKTMFTGRLATNLGVRYSLYVTPVAMIILIGVVLLAGQSASGGNTIFYLFGAISIAVDVLRTAINTPVLLTAMQPLPTHERLRAHNIVKGIMDPFSNLLCGIILLAMFAIQKEVNLISLCYVLLVLGAGWIISIILVNKDYVNMLIKTISSRFFSQEEFSLNDPETVHKIKEKIQTGSYPEVLSILQMVSTKQSPLSTELLADFLRHPSQEVKLEAIKLLGARQLHFLKDDLNAMLMDGTPEAVKQEAVKTLCRLAESTTVLHAYISSPDPGIRKAAIIGMLSNHRAATKLSAEVELQQMLSSGNQEELFTGIDILREVQDEYDHPDHARLLVHENKEIRKKAIQAVGAGASEETLEALTGQLSTSDKLVLVALQRSGKKAIPHIARALGDEASGTSKQQKLISLCGKIGGQQAQELLLQVLKTRPSQSAEAIRALFRSKYAAAKEERTFFEDIARAYLKYAVELLQMQQALWGQGQPSSIIFNAIELELLEIREVLLGLFSILYNREQIRKVRSGLQANQKESIANAMEIIELTVRKDIGRYFNIIYEKIPLDRKCDDLKALHTDLHYQETDQVLQRILSEQPILYQDWTKACSMYISKKYGLPLDSSLFEKYLEADTMILQETARYARA